MAWTAAVVSAQREGSEWAIVIAYSEDEGKPIKKGYRGTRFTATDLSNIARGEIAKLSLAKAEEGKVPFGPIDLTPPVASEVSKEQQEKNDWNIKRNELRALMDAARDGLIDISDKRIADLRIILRGAVDVNLP